MHDISIKLPGIYLKYQHKKKGCILGALTLLMLIVSCFNTAFAQVAATATGQTDGSFSVDLVGKANYNIPLFVVPGTAGMEPDLSINYNSNAGNGEMGTGFSLNGLSVITRGGTNKTNGSITSGVQYTENDNFYLDGQLLVLVSGTQGYPGSEYRTANESFSKVIYNSRSTIGGMGVTGPFFTVYTKDGRIYSYGTSNDSKIEATGNTTNVKIKTWAVTSITDRLGNYMTFEYLEDNINGAFYPSRINYTGNGTAGLLPYASVRFTYEVRPDNFIYWSTGDQSSLVKRLQNIKMYYAEDLVRTYNLTYQNSGRINNSKLIAVQECGIDGTCLEATRFNWTVNSQPVHAAVVTTNDISIGSGTNYTDWNNASGAAPTQMADVNGDGKDDLLAFGSAGLYVSIAGSGGSFGQPVLKISNFGSSQGWGGNSRRFAGDVNGDGILDIVGVNYTTTSYYISMISVRVYTYTNSTSVALGTGGGNFGSVSVYNSSSTQTSASSPYGYFYSTFLTDVNADGRQDLVALWTSGINVSLSNGIGYGPWQLASSSITATAYPVLMEDVNGDNLPDVLGFETGTDKVRVSLNGDNGIFKTAFDGTANYNGHRNGATVVNPSRLGDVNGDGMTDIVSFTNGGPYVALGKGNGYFKDGVSVLPNYFSQTVGWDHTKMPCFITDENGDGMADIVGFGTYGVYVSLASGNGNFLPYTISFSVFPNTEGWNGPQKPNMLADVDGDGIRDAIGLDHNIIKVSLCSAPKEAVASIVDGLGNTTAITYKPLTDPSVYTKGSGAAYPVTDVILPSPVVASVSVSNGVGGYNTINKTYSGFKLNRLRGTGGFERIITTDITQGIVKNTYYNASDYHYAGMPTVEYVNLTSGAYKSIAYFTPGYVSQGPATREYWFHYYSSTIEYKYESNGNFVLWTQVNNSFDGYGNLTQNTITKSDGHQLIATKTFVNDVANWLLGQTSTLQTQSIATNQTTITKNKSFTYKPYTLLLQSETTNPGHTLQLVKNTSYDVFGNATSLSSTGNNGWQGTETRTQLLNYDSKGRSLVSLQNAMGHIEYNESNVYFLKPYKQTDANGLFTYFSYDGFGRLKTTTMADGNVATQAIALCNGGNAPAYAKYSITKTPAAGLPPTIEYYDLLQRKIRVARTGFDGRQIFNDVYFNAKGQVAGNSLDYFAGDAAQWLSIYYDAFGRIANTYTPLKGYSGFYYYGLTTSSYNELSQYTTSLTDCNGQLVRSTDNTGNSINYEYNADGSVKKITDVNGVVSLMQYDINGNRTYFYDASTKGTNSYYNAFGEMYLTWNAANQTTSHQLDKLGRITYTSEPGITYTYSYDAGYKAVGKLSGMSGSNGYYELYYYDGYGRMYATNFMGWTFNKTYDQYSRESLLTYPQGLRVQNEYNAYNYLSKVKNYDNGLAYYTANTMNALGQVTLSTAGNNLQTQNIYNQIGQLNCIRTGVNSNVQNLMYWYNNLGNITGRRDYRRNIQELMTYDGLNRLQNATVTNYMGNTGNLASLQMIYAANGNITYKSDVGSYAYDQVSNAGPYAVTSNPLGSYGYDVVGNMTSGPGFSAAYNCFNLPSSYSTTSGKQYTYSYTPNHTKYYDAYYENGVLKKQTYYVENLYEMELSGNLRNDKSYILANGKVVAVFTQTNNNGALSNETVYLHADHLGSVCEITDAAGNIKESFSYDAWGKRRNPATWTSSGSFNTSPFYDLGYTGHENLDDLGLVNMKGRLYNPTLGRFLNADPYVQSPEYTQSYNRYSYVFNDPLSNIDPSGFDGESFGFDFNFSPSFDFEFDFGFDFGSGYNFTFDSYSQDFNSGYFDMSYSFASGTDLAGISGGIGAGNTSENQITPTQTVEVNGKLDYTTTWREYINEEGIQTFEATAHRIKKDPSYVEIVSNFVGITDGMTAFDRFRQGDYSGAAGYSLLAAAKAGAVVSGAGLLARGAGALTLRAAFGAAENRLLWTGLGKEGAKISKDYATNNGLKTLNMTPIGKSLEIADKVLPKSMMNPLWNQASAGFAKTAGSEVTLLRGSINLDRTFIRFEFDNIKGLINTIKY